MPRRPLQTATCRRCRPRGRARSDGRGRASERRIRRRSSSRLEGDRGTPARPRNAGSRPGRGEGDACDGSGAGLQNQCISSGRYGAYRYSSRASGSKHALDPSRSRTPARVSMIGLASRSGTAVLPTWCMPLTSHSPIASSSVDRSSSNRAGQDGSYGESGIGSSGGSGPARADRGELIAVSPSGLCERSADRPQRQWILR